MRVPYRFHDKRSYRRAVARIFSEKNPPPARGIGVEIYSIPSPRHIIRTTYTRRDLPPPATELPLKQHSREDKGSYKYDPDFAGPISNFKIIITRLLESGDVSAYNTRSRIYPNL